MGNGASLYRKADHQVMKNGLVVRGNMNPTSDFDRLEVLDVVSREKLTYDPNEGPFAGGAQWS
jgi:branched-chain amino acid transport system substrate-binding protein